LAFQTKRYTEDKRLDQIQDFAWQPFCALMLATPVFAQAAIQEQVRSRFTFNNDVANGVAPRRRRAWTPLQVLDPSVAVTLMREGRHRERCSVQTVPFLSPFRDVSWIDNRRPQVRVSQHEDSMKATEDWARQKDCIGNGAPLYELVRREPWRSASITRHGANQYDDGKQDTSCPKQLHHGTTARVFH